MNRFVKALKGAPPIEYVDRLQGALETPPANSTWYALRDRLREEVPVPVLAWTYKRMLRAMIKVEAAEDLDESLRDKFCDLMDPLWYALASQFEQAEMERLIEDREWFKGHLEGVHARWETSSG